MDMMAKLKTSAVLAVVAGGNLSASIDHATDIKANEELLAMSGRVEAINHMGPGGMDPGDRATLGFYLGCASFGLGLSGAGAVRRKPE